jgi:hypothetical protein
MRGALAPEGANLYTVVFVILTVAAARPEARRMFKRLSLLIQ